MCFKALIELGVSLLETWQTDKQKGSRAYTNAIPADICPARKRRLPGRQLQSVRGSAATRQPRRPSPLQDRSPSRCRQQSRSRQECVGVGCRVLFAERAAGGTFRGLHTLHGRLCPTRPENVSAPCAKF